MPIRKTPAGLALTGLAAAALIAAGCGSSSSSSSSSSPAPAPAASSSTASGTDSAVSLKGVCPSTINVQTDWNPESDHSELYELASPDGTTDNSKKTYTSELMSQGKDTGVKIQIRSGGPAIGFQTVTAQMYQDNSIYMGYVSTDEAAQFSAKQPTVGVVAPRENTPFMLMFDPSKHNFKTIADIGKTNTKVLYFRGAAYMDYLLGAGLLKKSQVDGSYDGTPARFVTAGGSVAQQGFLTAEPYMYEHEIKQWMKPVGTVAVSQTGFNPYPEALSVRKADMTKDSACLKKLVPMIQQAQVDYVKDPTAANALIVKLVPGYKTGWVYPSGLASYAVKAQVDKKIISDGPDSTLGNFDDTRVAKTISQVTPIYAKNKTPVKAGLTPADITTNQFIDKSIGLG